VKSKAAPSTYSDAGTHDATMRKTMKRLRQFVKNEAGAEIAEYAVAVAILVAIGVVCYNSIANAIAYNESSTASAIDASNDNPFIPTP
jgi:Flp pilus assembly pilin Flp